MEVPDEPKKIGDFAVLKSMCMLLQHGYTVLEPRGDNSRYDLVAEAGGKFCRIQAKSRRHKNGLVRVELRSSSGTKKTHHYYTPEEVDFIVIYCPDNDEVYWIPMEDIRGHKEVRVRVSSDGFRVNKRTRLGSMYGIDRLRSWFDA